MDLDFALQTSVSLAIKAGQAILEIYNSEDHQITKKENSSILTAADTAANKIIMEGLRQAFPQCGLLSEEDEDDHSRLAYEYVFIVDPLDGTAHFVRRDGEFTVNIALVKNGVPVMGVIYVPVYDHLYHAMAGKGAYLETSSQKKLLKVTSTDSVQQSRLVTGRGASIKIAGLLNHPFASHQVTGSSLKGCIIASGNAEAYLRFSNINEWDICAMHIILEEAGGKMTKVSGESISYNQESTCLKGGFIASNSQIHENLYEVHSKISSSGGETFNN